VGRKVGAGCCAPFRGGSWVPIEHNVTWVEAYLRIERYPGASSRLATIHIGREVGGGCCAPFGWNWVPAQDNVAWAEAYLRTK